MTIPTLTHSGATTPDLPDPLSLARLANELFHSPAAVPPVPSSEAVNIGGIPGLQAALPSGSFYFLDEIPAAAPASEADRLDFSAVPSLDLAPRPFDPHAVKRDFPILQEYVHGKPLIWLDNGATTQKPQAVIDRLSYFYEHENSNIHRAAHELAARSTDAYEGAREKVRRFLNAGSTREIVFVRGATEGINLVAKSWGHRHIGKDDEIVITWLEHHANIVPWQQLCAEKGAVLRVAPVDDNGDVILEEFEKLLNDRTKLVSLTHVSNALGTITPAKELVAIAHRYGARVLVDGAQSVPHMQINVQDLDCDWYVFSGHKMFAPTGIGAVYGKEHVLNEAPPWQGGGNMIVDVTFEKTVYHAAPARFEAGTGNIADAVGLGAAIDYLERIGMENISRYEHGLLLYATERLETIPGLTLYGKARDKAGVLSFTLAGFETEAVGKALDREGIAVRAGHHCAQPILRRFGVEATVRASLALYNTCEDIDALVAALLKIRGG
jgi:cysteine desulfurase/selenocysteine lyase